MKLFKRSFKETLEEVLKRRLPMNSLERTNDDKDRVWLNPRNQDCFNSGWFNQQDFEDFLHNTGPIIKGKTQEEKDKFIEYANFMNTYHYGWAIGSGFKHFKKIMMHNYKYYANGIGREVTNPVLINSRNRWGKETDVQTGIAKIFSSMIPSLISDLNSYTGLCDQKTFDRVHARWRDESYGMKKALNCQGLGHFGACNTPEEIDNLSWYGDLVFTYAYYKHLLSNGVKMPDFKFVQKHRYDR